MISLATSCAGGIADPRVARIVFPGRGMSATTEVIGRMRPGDPASVGATAICLDRPGQARITGIGLVRSTGLRVSDFAVRKNPFLKPHGVMLGDAREPLVATGFPSRRTVDWACKRRSARVYELGVEFRLVSAAPGRTVGFDIEFTSSGQKGTLYVPYTIVLCPGEGHALRC